jgi:hypothetical protein
MIRNDFWSSTAVMSTTQSSGSAAVESECGEILETAEEREWKLKLENGNGPRGRDSGQRVSGCNSLSVKELWLGGRDSNSKQGVFLTSKA